MWIYTKYSYYKYHPNASKNVSDLKEYVAASDSAWTRLVAIHS